MEVGMPGKILVEARKDPIPAAMLDSLAEECERLGHHVVRWRGPLSGRLPYPRWLGTCDAAILFNGAHRSYRPALARLRAQGAATIFVELGWHPQAGHYQVDPKGVNAAASWVEEPLEYEGRTPLAIRPEGDLLVLLQLDDDTQVTERSPWFPNMESLVRFLGQHSRLPVRVRPHPLDRHARRLRNLVARSNAVWDEPTTLEESLSAAKAVACINSSAAVEAMAAGLPVLCYGEAVYRQANVVYCLDADGESTVEATTEIASGICSLVKEAVGAMIARIAENQWTIHQIPERLEPLLNEVLAAAQSPARNVTSSERIEQTISWITDLPAKILYRRRLRNSRKAS
jgi:hypothetical protein